MSGTTGNEVRVGTDLTPEEARTLTDEIRIRLEDIAPLVTRAYQGNAAGALGYDSWTEYVAGEFGGPLRLGREDRKQVVAELRQAGLSTRGIGQALGVGQATVVRDIGGDSFGSPEQITGTDGKTYSATRQITEQEQQFANEVWAEVHSEDWYLTLELAIDSLREAKRWAQDLNLNNRDRKQVKAVRALAAEAQEIVTFISEKVR